MKIPKGYPETVNHRKTTENAIAKTKRMERQIMMHKTLHRKQKIDKDKRQNKSGVASCAPEGKQFLLHQ